MVNCYRTGWKAKQYKKENQQIYIILQILDIYQVLRKHEKRFAQFNVLRAEVFKHAVVDIVRHMLTVGNITTLGKYCCLIFE